MNQRSTGRLPRIPRARPLIPVSSAQILSASLLSAADIATQPRRLLVILALHIHAKGQRRLATCVCVFPAAVRSCARVYSRREAPCSQAFHFFLWAKQLCAVSEVCSGRPLRVRRGPHSEGYQEPPPFSPRFWGTQKCVPKQGERELGGTGFLHPSIVCVSAACLRACQSAIVSQKNTRHNFAAAGGHSPTEERG